MRGVSDDLAGTMAAFVSIVGPISQDLAQQFSFKFVLGGVRYRPIDGDV